MFLPSLTFSWLLQEDPLRGDNATPSRAGQWRATCALRSAPLMVAAQGEAMRTMFFRQAANT
jgi:hypothetical protein